LIWAAFRFGPPAVTLCIAITAAITIGVTADKVGAFYKQPIDNRTLSTQLYVLVAALTALFLSAVVAEHRRSVEQLAESKRRESEGAIEERRRIARELHDSVSQALFSTVLHARVAHKILDAEAGLERSGRLSQALGTIEQLAKRAQSEMRRFIFEWGPEGIGDGLGPALSRHVASLAEDPIDVRVEGPSEPLPLTRTAETQLFGIGREALANVAKHARARSASVRVVARPSSVVLEVADDGCGFEPSSPAHGGGFGLGSMRSRAEEIGGVLHIISGPGRGTVVRVEVPTNGGRNGG
jgi:signal transduction histidine kinase